jgi:hypothetical protein
MADNSLVSKFKKFFKHTNKEQTEYITQRSNPQFDFNEWQKIDNFIVEESVAIDTQTGLMWLRFSYGQEWKNGNVTGIAKKVDWLEAKNLGKNYAGYSDWRIPTIKELKTLILKNTEKTGYINNIVFPASGKWYWSSSVHGDFDAYDVNFENGEPSYSGQASIEHVRFVRTVQNIKHEQQKSQVEHKKIQIQENVTSQKTVSIEFGDTIKIGKFIVQDGIAIDTKTDLMWLRFAHGQQWKNAFVENNASSENWHEAMEIPQKFNQQGGYFGYEDWRLPTVNELKTLIESETTIIYGISKLKKTVNLEVFPENTGVFWSASPTTQAGTNAWYVNFLNYESSWELKTRSYFIRLVRNTKSLADLSKLEEIKKSEQKKVDSPETIKFVVGNCVAMDEERWAIQRKEAKAAQARWIKKHLQGKTEQFTKSKLEAERIAEQGQQKKLGVCKKLTFLLNQIKVIKYEQECEAKSKAKQEIEQLQATHQKQLELEKERLKREFELEIERLKIESEQKIKLELERLKSEIIKTTEIIETETILEVMTVEVETEEKSKITVPLLKDEATKDFEDMF